MHRFLLTITTLAIFGVAAQQHATAAIVTFEDVPVAAGSFNNGNPGGTGNTFATNTFTSQGISFTNTYTRSGGFEYWNGWSISNMTDTTTPGFGNQYSSFAGSGSGPSLNFGVSTGDFDAAFNDNSISIPIGQVFQSIDITNTTYAAISMRDGDSFSKRFGGATGSDPDYFKLIITGRAGGPTGTAVGAVEVFLADYTGDSQADYILDQWETVNLSSLAGADTLTFTYDSTDVSSFDGGQTFFINTPQFFAADNLVFGPPVSAAVPEPSSWVVAIVCGLAGVWFYRRQRRTRQVV